MMRLLTLVLLLLLPAAGLTQTSARRQIKVRVGLLVPETCTGAPACDRGAVQDFLQGLHRGFNKANGRFRGYTFETLAKDTRGTFSGALEAYNSLPRDVAIVIAYSEREALAVAGAAAPRVPVLAAFPSSTPAAAWQNEFLPLFSMGEIGNPAAAPSFALAKGESFTTPAAARGFDSAALTAAALATQPPTAPGFAAAICRQDTFRGASGEFNFLESRRSRPGRSRESYCGCGLPALDANLNGIIDCDESGHWPQVVESQRDGNALAAAVLTGPQQCNCGYGGYCYGDHGREDCYSQGGPPGCTGECKTGGCCQ